MSPALFLLFVLLMPATRSIEADAMSDPGTFTRPDPVSGIYPHLAMFNDENECGVGAVVPWAGRLWVVTYAPHKPFGSSDRLYSITEDLEQVVHPASVGGTPANRMIHDESGQLFISHYAIDEDANVRVIPFDVMPGRPTGLARHLESPADRVYLATMEEGFYDIDVRTLEVTTLFPDAHVSDERLGPHPASGGSLLPGYHGKGLYSGQGVLVYANNGETGAAAQRDPRTTSGVLAEWDGEDWTIVRRNQFTEVTGPGGIHGNPNPATDPIWSVGWDAKSVLLGVRRPGEGWSFRRLPKGSHSYDGAHGWNTEWPRIRDIGERDLLMTMHGTLWRFPGSYGVDDFGGISPRSNVLKVIGDFCDWNDRVVFGCDDTAKAEFLNTRKAKGEIAAPQSQSNLWFVDHAALDGFGPLLGRGLVWEREDVDAMRASDPFLFAGYDHRCLHLSHEGTSVATVRLETEVDGAWDHLRSVRLEPGGATTTIFTDADHGDWIRLVPMQDMVGATAAFSFRERDDRPVDGDAIFDGLATSNDGWTGGIVRARGGNERTLSLAAVNEDGKDIGYYELDGDLVLRRVDDVEAHRFTKERASIPTNVLTIEKGSVLFIDDAGHRWRLPRSTRKGASSAAPPARVDREVATERDLFNADGTFYELPAENAGGFAKVRPVATHGRLIHDYASYRGLLVMSGVQVNGAGSNARMIQSDDQKVGLWVGAIDDVWDLGKPRGTGGPWWNATVEAGDVSDPYLMTGYDDKRLLVESTADASITMELDITGEGDWIESMTIELVGGADWSATLPRGLSAYWIRFWTDRATTVTTMLEYE